jgi:2-dehydropantoate 2-reductase
VLVAMNGVPWWFFEGGFGGEIDRPPAEGGRPGWRHRQGHSGAQRDRLRGACELRARREPGVVRHHFGNGLIVGEPSGEATRACRHWSTC